MKRGSFVVNKFLWTKVLYQINRQALALYGVILIFTGLCFGQSVTLSPKSGPPTTKTYVSGSRFAPNAEIDLYFGTKNVAIINANSSGSFSKFALEIPASSLPGDHWVSAEQVSTDTGAQAPFKVNTNWPTYGFVASGGRWNRYENVLNKENVGSLSLNWFYTDPQADLGATSPIVANGKAYIGFVSYSPPHQFSYVDAVNVSTGAGMWSSAPISTQAGMNAPVVADTGVYVGYANLVDVYLSALNAKSGAELWNVGVGANVGPTAPVVANGLVYVGGEPDDCFALNPATGDVVWDFSADETIYGMYSPAVADGVVYIGSSDGNFYALNATTGTKLWSFAAGGNVNSTPAVANGTVYFSTSGNFYALNAATGVQLWSVSSDAGFSNLAVANGVVYVGSDELYALNAASGAKLWSFTSVGGASYGSPVAANGVIYVTTLSDDLGTLYALNAATGKALWTVNNAAGFSDPIVADGVLYVGSYPPSLEAYGLPEAAAPKASVERPALSSLRPDPSLKAAGPADK
jgi:outer membrane protein assembly factor BamB